MTGNSDEGRQEPGPSDVERLTSVLLERAFLKLATMMDEAVDRLAETPAEAGDVVAIGRRARAITSLMRTIQAGMALRQAVFKARRQSETEDDMGGHRDIDPEDLVRLHQQLDTQLDSLRACIEAKRVEGWDITPAAGTDDPEDRLEAA